MKEEVNYSEWNSMRPYDFLDRRPRFKNDQGFWVPVDVANGKGDWTAKTGELLEDWIGFYILLNNDVKAYSEISPLVIKDIRSGKYKNGNRPNFYYMKIDYKKKYKPSNI